MTKLTTAQLVATANYDEAKIVPYTLPDPLACADGVRVTTPEHWKHQRRREILSLFSEHVYGKMYPALPIHARIIEQSDQAINGKATRLQVAITFPSKTITPAPTLNLLLYLPNHLKRPAPCFLGLNFFGNHAATTDPAVLLSTQWMRDDGVGVVDHHATEASRGSEKHRWPIEDIIERGYALATMYCGDIDPDYDHNFTLGIHPIFRPPEATNHAPKPNDAGTITAWAWGLSRAMDYLVTLPSIDAERVCLTGHSRLGKTALWAAACDERFALAISNNSGCGGAALSRRNFGETPQIISQIFGRWYCPRFHQHAPHIETIPVDQHMLIALIAPRPVFVSSAEDDKWADPRGEFLAAFHAGDVYRLLGETAITSDVMPPLNTPIMSRVGYKIRPGKHDITPADWATHLDFADAQLAR
jgi:hypothetical protein